MAKFNIGDKVLCNNISYDGDTWSAIVTEILPRGTWYGHYKIAFDGVVVPAVNTTNANGPQGGMSSVACYSTDLVPYIDKTGDDVRRMTWPALQVTRKAESEVLQVACREKQANILFSKFAVGNKVYWGSEEDLGCGQFRCNWQYGEIKTLYRDGLWAVIDSEGTSVSIRLSELKIR